MNRRRYDEVVSFVASILFGAAVTDFELFYTGLKKSGASPLAAKFTCAIFYLVYFRNIHGLIAYDSWAETNGYRPPFEEKNRHIFFHLLFSGLAAMLLPYITVYAFSHYPEWLYVNLYWSTFLLYSPIILYFPWNMFWLHKLSATKNLGCPVSEITPVSKSANPCLLRDMADYFNILSVGFLRRFSRLHQSLFEFEAEFFQWVERKHFDRKATWKSQKSDHANSEKTPNLDRDIAKVSGGGNSNPSIKPKMVLRENIIFLHNCFSKYRASLVSWIHANYPQPTVNPFRGYFGLKYVVCLFLPSIFCIFIFYLIETNLIEPRKTFRQIKTEFRKPFDDLLTFTILWCLNDLIVTVGFLLWVAGSFLLFSYQSTLYWAFIALGTAAILFDYATHFTFYFPVPDYGKTENNDGPGPANTAATEPHGVG